MKKSVSKLVVCLLSSFLLIQSCQNINTSPQIEVKNGNSFKIKAVSGNVTISPNFFSVTPEGTATLKANSDGSYILNFTLNYYDVREKYFDNWGVPGHDGEELHVIGTIKLTGSNGNYSGNSSIQMGSTDTIQILAQRFVSYDGGNCLCTAYNQMNTFVVAPINAKLNMLTNTATIDISFSGNTITNTFTTGGSSGSEETNFSVNVSFTDIPFTPIGQPTPTPIPTLTPTPYPTIPPTTPDCSQSEINNFNKNVDDSVNALNKLNNLLSQILSSTAAFKTQGFYTSPMYDQGAYDLSLDIQQRTADVKAMENSAIAEERQAYQEYHAEAAKIIAASVLVAGTAGMSAVPGFLTSLAATSPEVFYLAVESPQVLAALNRASALITALKVLKQGQCLEPSLVTGVNNSKSALSTIDDMLNGIFKATGKNAKSVSLPSWSKLKIDWTEVLTGHQKDGVRAVQSQASGKGKDIFPDYMTQNQIEQAMKEAYSNAKKLQTQGDRILVQGVSESTGLPIEMWVNTQTKIIETAYPKFSNFKPKF